MPSRTDAPARPPIAAIDLRNEIYSYALGLLQLRPEALHDLTRRGLSPETITFVGFRSIPRLGAEHQAFMCALRERFEEGILRACPGFTDKNGRLTFWSAYGERDGYVVPYRDEFRQITGLQQKRLGGGYLTPFGAQLNGVYNVAGHPMPGCDVYLTEGGTKSIVAHEFSGLLVFAVCGQALHQDHVEVIKRFEPARCVVGLDREENRNTTLARRRWLEMLDAAGLPTYDGVWEGSDVGGPKGLDDLLRSRGQPRLRHVTFVPARITDRRTPQQIPVAGDIDAGGSMASARTATRKAIHEFIGEAERHRGEAVLIKTPPGAAKTTATAEAIDAHRARARIVVGTNRLARELADRFGYAQIEGRNEENCERLDVVHALADDGHDIEELACGTEKEPRCPARDRCAYWRQFDQLGTRVAAAEQMYNPRFLQGGSVVVADDADLMRSMIEQHALTTQAISRAHRGLARRRREPTRQLVAAVGRALVDAQLDDISSPLLGAHVWDHLVQSAKRHNDDFAALVAALPADGTLPLPGNDGEAVLTVDDVEHAVPGSVRVVLDVLRQELPRFLTAEDFNSCLRIDGAGIRVSRMRAPAKSRYGQAIIDELPLLVLEATPVESLVAHLMSGHSRMPDVSVSVALPDNVTVTQYTTSSNGKRVLEDPERRRDVLAEIAAERGRLPVSGPKRQAAICFRWMREEIVETGFDGDRVMTFGSARGSNALSEVERLHVVGRPMAPTDALLHLAQVIHHDQATISRRMTRCRPNSGRRSAAAGHGTSSNTWTARSTCA